MPMASSEPSSKFSSFPTSLKVKPLLNHSQWQTSIVLDPQDFGYAFNKAGQLRQLEKDGTTISDRPFEFEVWSLNALAFQWIEHKSFRKHFLSGETRRQGTQSSTLWGFRGCYHWGGVQPSTDSGRIGKKRGRFGRWEQERASVFRVCLTWVSGEGKAAGSFKK